MKFLDNISTKQTNKIIETNTYYYINGMCFDKSTMNPIVFKTFCDGGLSNAFMFYNTLAPFIEQKYFNGLKKNSILVDNNNPNICYVPSHIVVKKHYNSSSEIDFQINIINNENGIFTQKYYYNNSRWGKNFVTWLGQSDRFLYASIVGNENSTNPTVSSSPIDAEIIAIPKELKDIQAGAYNDRTSDVGIKILSTYNKSNGVIKIIKEDEVSIYFIVEKDGYQYDFSKLQKENNSITVLSTFNVFDKTGDSEKLYKDNTSSGVCPSDIIKINDNEYECYISGREIINSDDLPTYKNIISKIKFNLSQEIPSIEIKELILNEEPFFKHKFGAYYNEIFAIDKDENRYLITMTNCFYDSVDKFDKTEKVISMYKLDTKESINGNLVDSIKSEDLQGDFFGMIKNLQNNSFFVMTSGTTYIFEIDFSTNKFIKRNLSVLLQEIGIDLDGNCWGIDTLSQVFLYSKETSDELKIEMDNIPQFEGNDVDTIIKISCKNYEGNYVVSKVQLKIMGNAVFKDDNSKIKMIETLSNNTKDIEITIKDGGILDIVGEIVF